MIADRSEEGSLFMRRVLLGLIVIGVVFLLAFVCLQLRASWLLAESGNGQQYCIECMKCGAVRVDIIGRHFPGQVIVVKRKKLVDQGSMGCLHKWRTKREKGLADGRSPRGVPHFLLTASWWMFRLCCCLLLIPTVLLVAQLARRRR